MKSHHLLSPTQYQYLTSQDSITNPSEHRKRISLEVEKAFNTFDMILTSQYVSQEFKDKWFDVSTVEKFLDNFTRFDKQNSPSEEMIKQAICKIMITKGLDYFKGRYGEMELIKENIKQATSLVSAIEFLSNQEQYDNEAMEMYRVRSRSVRPNFLVAEKDFWVSECKFCFNSTSHAKTKKEAIKNLRHTKGCLFTKDVKKQGGRHKDYAIQRYIIIYPPRDKPKSG